MVIGILHDWEYPPYTNLHFQEHAREFASAAPGTFMTIPIYPPGWALRITKKNPACHSLPIGFIEKPSENARVSGIVTVSGWVTGIEPVRQISVYVDHSLVQSTTPSLKRVDVDENYPQSAVKDKGWATAIDLSKIPPGQHEIEARAFGTEACEADIARVVVEKVNK
jgi:hypothetical protein